MTERRKGGGSGRTASTGRGMAVRVKTARGRSLSSTLWLQRQLNDPYVAEAQRLGLRSRAAFKLMELDDRLGLLRPGMRVVDLGAAPGGWSQVAVQRVGAGGPGGGLVVGIDIAPWEPLPGATCLTHDFMAADAPALLRQALNGPADAVLSDMAANTTGHPATDHLRIVGLVEAAYAFAEEVLAPGGVFVAKVFQGGTEHKLLATMKRRFATVRHIKPPASRKDSSEIYLVAMGFREG
ncbi:MAG: RlmE family RNA methyltransferase [Alphaproteobacteria bacterium]